MKSQTRSSTSPVVRARTGWWVVVSSIADGATVGWPPMSALAPWRPGWWSWKKIFAPRSWTWAMAALRPAMTSSRAAEGWRSSPTPWSSLTRVISTMMSPAPPEARSFQ